MAFPTETVYGLGAHALDPEAVERIFEVKDRPETHPLIVHVGDIEVAMQWSDPWSEEAQRLAEHFWPGPLTLIVPRNSRLPAEVTGGLETVGLRMPSHPVGMALLRRADLPVAAPSANPHQHLSPTRAEHVVHGLGERVDMVIDGGATDVGIESTVLSLCEDVPTILRPGAIGRDHLASLLDSVAWADDAVPDPETRRPSPGMSARHYAPETRVRLAAEVEDVVELDDSGAIGWLLLDGSSEFEPRAGDVVERLPSEPASYAAGLYAALHNLDRASCTRIVVQSPPRHEGWRAVWNRLERASTPGR